jgi:hypothetical protein
MKRVLSIAGLALLGVVIAVAVTMVASDLSSQSIGISEEPVTAGEELAPARTATQKASPRPPRTATTHRPPPRTVAPPPPPPPAAVATTDDDHGGRGRGRGGDDSDDD